MPDTDSYHPGTVFWVSICLLYSAPVFQVRIVQKANLKTFLLSQSANIRVRLLSSSFFFQYCCYQYRCLYRILHASQTPDLSEGKKLLSMVPDILKRTGSTKPGPKPSERSPVLGAASRTDSAKNLSSAKGSNSVRNLSAACQRNCTHRNRARNLSAAKIA